ncbi:hypothetical protein PIROE2DRAFT_13406 [Piromyces sp. E2]|nr:hypothetical protein PIROE2DRAFT_13406 [Piromyces sp. E2]|eukprot:OUM60768.1 hypothetical protein PIROE2DRAFT_13406 [Piromyces sp. E2]
MAFEIGILHEDLNVNNNGNIFASSTGNDDEKNTITDEYMKEKKNSISSLDFNKDIRGSLPKMPSTFKSSTSIASSNHSKNAELKLALLNQLDSEKKDDKDKTELFDLNKIIVYIHSFLVEVICIYVIILIILVSVTVGYHFKEGKTIQEEDKKWRYDCPLIKFDLILNLIEFFLLIYLNIGVIKVWNFIFVFRCVKYIRYSTIVWITIGPLANVYIIYINC